MDKLTKKEKEILEKLANEGHVIVDDIKELKKIAPKLEKIFGRADEIYEQIK